MGVGELMDRVIAAIRTAPRSTWLFGVLVVLALGALELLATALLPFGGIADLLVATGTGGEAWQDEALSEVHVLAGQLVTSTLASVVGAVATTVIVGWTARSLALAAPGASASPSPTWRALRPRLGGLLALMLLTVLVVTAAVAVPALLVALAVGTGSVGLVVLAAALGLAGTVAVLVRFAPAVVLALPEHATTDPAAGGPGASLRRAAGLVAGERWRLVGIWLLTVVVLTIAGGVVSTPFTGIGTYLAPDSLALWSVLGSIVASAVTAPLGALVLSLVHTELAERRGAPAAR
ncbi:hypothetical protein C8046_17300 [Serinibacter arcticus]|uniref:Integral membrane protein n=2 Tax=Serinibacter arcticus TaxID=1655435 RepID=A0A2U1ZYR7_9MICO|nr:hypothetical protein C8046_17300 [Serinibacter arcticus]